MWRSDACIILDTSLPLDERWGACSKKRGEEIKPGCYIAFYFPGHRGFSSNNNEWLKRNPRSNARLTPSTVPPPPAPPPLSPPPPSRRGRTGGTAGGGGVSAAVEKVTSSSSASSGITTAGCTLEICATVRRRGKTTRYRFQPQHSDGQRKPAGDGQNLPPPLGKERVDRVNKVNLHTNIRPRDASLLHKKRCYAADREYRL